MVCVILIFVLIMLGYGASLVAKEISLNSKYKSALELYEKGDYESFLTAAEEIEGYKNINDLIENSKEKINEDSIERADNLFKKEEYTEALDLFKDIGLLEKDPQYIEPYAKELMDARKYDVAYSYYKEIPGDEKYQEFCDIMYQLENVQEGDNLSNLYDRVLEMGDFNHIDYYLSNNQYLKIINRIESLGEKWISYSDNNKIIYTRNGYAFSGNNKYSYYAVNNEAAKTILSLKEPKQEYYVTVNNVRMLNWGGEFFH